ncbi:DUF222 domain-containing protein [Amnibacterium setariae]|uniref:HNH endonuclease n=1 Tax=Amnibacterium setariae TaxID=2306585 RepID=A0A3A1TVL5_9MICO|nr:HNH endonuclease signature motif containing protein [Amnibacterium setariae]RIX27561.1 HNH endonuclease [Amnibacterium setariae]
MSEANEEPQMGTPVLLPLARRRWTRNPALDDMPVVQTVAIGSIAAPGDDTHAALAGWDEETRGWALQKLAAAHLDPAAWRASVVLEDRNDVSDEEWERMDCAPNALPEGSELFQALADVEDLQRLLQGLEARRVVAALRAWRAALADEGRPGAANTPYQKGLFLDLGAKLKVADSTAKTLVHTAARLERDLPLVWAHFLAGRAPWRAMQIVHAAAEGLDDAVLPVFDAKAVLKLDEVLMPSLPDALRRLAERLQPTTADERHERAAARRRYTIEAAADGMGWLHLFAPMADLLGMDHQVTKQAIAAHGRADERRGIQILKADVLRDGLRAFLRTDADPAREGDALVPGRRGVVPRVSILIPAMTALGRSTAAPVLQGYGPIGIRTALRIAGEATSWIRVLTDPFTGAPLSIGREKYRPTEDMRAFIRLLDGGNRGPGRPRGPDEVDIDHAESFRAHDERGETSVDNLMLLSRSDHGAKTAGAADADLLLDRTVVWQTPSGNKYVTRPLDPPEATPIPTELTDEDDCPF